MTTEKSKWNSVKEYPIPQTRAIDIWAKTWDSATDKFCYHRFADCYYNNGVLKELPEDYYPTHWMEIPEGPDGD